MREIRRIDDRQGVGRARLSALAVLYFGGECSLSQLAETEMVSRATMHHVVNGLEREGYVTRTPDLKDARRQIIRLSAEGTRAIKAAHAERIDYLRHIAEDVDPGELAAAVRILDHLRNRSRARPEQK